MIERVLCSFLAGFLLSQSGSSVQFLTKSSLASPSTIGLNAYSVLFIMISYALIETGLGYPVSAESFAFFLFCLGTFPLGLWFLYRVKNKKKKSFGNQEKSSFGQKLIIFGLCFNLFVGAIFSFLQFIFIGLNLEFPTQLWFGNFKFIDPHGLKLLILVGLFSCLTLWRLSPMVSLLRYGHDVALNWRIPVSFLQFALLALSLLQVALINSFFGVFAFLGLIFPHLLRSFSWFRHHARRELIWGAILNGLILSLFDYLCFSFPLMGAEIPVGMVTALMGTFFLMLILVHDQRKRSISSNLS